MDRQIEIEWSDVDKSCLEALGFTLSDSFAVKDLPACRVVLRAKDDQIHSELKTLSGTRFCASSGPTVLEALWNLEREYRKTMDELREMEDDLDDLSRDLEREYTRNEP